MRLAADSAAARVRELLTQCCRMCGPGQEHACERQVLVPFETVEVPGRLDPVGPLDPGLQDRLTRISGRAVTATNLVRLLRDGTDTFVAMLELIEGAETEHRLGRLLDAGLNVWHWNGAMMHAKTVVVDRCWSLIGSTNLDWLSLRRNAELNIEVHGSRVGEQMVEMFAADRLNCAPFALGDWQARSPARRALTWLAALADPVM